MYELDRLTDGPGRYGAEEGPPLHVGELHGEREVGHEVTPSAEARSQPSDDEHDPVWGEGVAQAQRKLTCTWRYIYIYVAECICTLCLCCCLCVALSVFCRVCSTSFDLLRMRYVL